MFKPWVILQFFVMADYFQQIATKLYCCIFTSLLKPSPRPLWSSSRLCHSLISSKWGNKELNPCLQVYASHLYCEKVIFFTNAEKCCANWNLFWIYLDKLFSIMLGFVLFYNIGFWQGTFSNHRDSDNNNIFINLRLVSDQKVFSESLMIDLLTKWKYSWT